MGDQPKKPRGLKPEQWAEVRSKFEAGISYARLSKDFGIRRPTITDRARREGWTVQATVHVHGDESVQGPPGETIAKTIQKRAQASVIDIATRRALESPSAQAAIDAAAAAVVEEAAELVATVTTARKAARYMNDVLDAAMAGKIEPASSPGQQTVADVAKAVMAAYRTFTTTVRDNSGLRPGTPSIAKDGDRGEGAKVKFVIVNAPTGTDG